MEETTMTTTDKNKLIAEFMGYIDNGCSEDGFLIHPETNYDIDVSELQYHSSYDWIMPVVERIEEMGSSTICGIKMKGSFDISAYGIKFFYTPNNKYLLQLEFKPFLSETHYRSTMYKHHVIKTFDFKNNSKLSAIYNAVVEFIMWYNLNKGEK